MKTLKFLFILSFPSVSWASFIDPITPIDASPVLDNYTLEVDKLIFSDEFSSFNSDKWNVLNSLKTRKPRFNKGIKSWFFVDENVCVSNGYAYLISTKPSSDKLFASAIDTKGKFEFKFGYLEARIRVAPIQSAVHTALWLYSENASKIDSTPINGVEIDIFESPYYSDRAQSAIHWNGYGVQHKSIVNKWDAPFIHHDFNVFGILWTDEKILIFFNGILVSSFPKNVVPSSNEFIRISTGASFADGDFGNFPFPIAASIDYIRVWSLQ